MHLESKRDLKIESALNDVQEFPISLPKLLTRDRLRAHSNMPARGNSGTRLDNCGYKSKHHTKENSTQRIVPRREQSSDLKVYSSMGRRCKPYLLQFICQAM
jgi:hypothetical protein